MNYTDALEWKAQLEAELARTSNGLQGFPRLANGLTPDHVKSSFEFKTAKLAYNSALARLKQFNGAFFKTFAREEKARRNEALARAVRGELPSTIDATDITFSGDAKGITCEGKASAAFTALAIP